MLRKCLSFRVAGHFSSSIVEDITFEMSNSSLELVEMGGGTRFVEISSESRVLALKVKFANAPISLLNVVGEVYMMYAAGSGRIENSNYRLSASPLLVQNCSWNFRIVGLFTGAVAVGSSVVYEDSALNHQRCRATHRHQWEFHARIRSRLDLHTRSNIGGRGH